MPADAFDDMLEDRADLFAGRLLLALARRQIIATAPLTRFMMWIGPEARSSYGL